METSTHLVEFFQLLIQKIGNNFGSLLNQLDNQHSLSLPPNCVQQAGWKPVGNLSCAGFRRLWMGKKTGKLITTVFRFLEAEVLGMLNRKGLLVCFQWDCRKTSRNHFKWECLETSPQKWSSLGTPKVVQPGVVVMPGETQRWGGRCLGKRWQKNTRTLGQSKKLLWRCGARSRRRAFLAEIACVIYPRPFNS